MYSDTSFPVQLPGPPLLYPLTYSNKRASTFKGTRPILWAKFSSGIILVFYHIVTFSIAIVGTSDIIILLKAFASGGSAPIKSNTILSSVNCFTSISTFKAKCLRFDGSRCPVTDAKLAGCSKVEGSFIPC